MNFEKGNDYEIYKENKESELNSQIIEGIENLLNPTDLKEKKFLAEQTEKCCSNLNESFTFLFKNGNTKDGKKYDFLAALKKTVENPIG